MAALSFSPIRPSVELVRFASSLATGVRPSSFSACVSASSRRLDCHPVLPTIRPKREDGFCMVRATTEQALSDQSGSMDQVEEDVCELVSRLELTLGEGQDAADAYLVKAMKNNNGAAILLLTDVFGFNNNDTRDFAYRLSCFGYNVLVPDLFQGMPWTKDRPKSDFENWRAKHPAERVAKAIKTAADWLTEEITAAGVTKKLGLLGFCFGGGRILEVLAKDSEQQYATAVSFYPTRLDETLATRISVPILLISGDKDELCPSDKLRNIAGQIKGSEARIYPGRGHAFAHCPTSDDDEDAEDAFVVMKAWFHEKLVSH
ncbi:hypothetical protein GOP47_0025907 [Adiantum capillus-veneris]|uniref:Carboxymethylenebutenolidase homolog n=1 Tax=Adiantum capillus-veneris TaxID=13818 RepID=A0A9D4Z2J1_ADICA|nr:hypothetical protein GOP47_0025907 [Adiantum capillus-veneris]